MSRLDPGFSLEQSDAANRAMLSLIGPFLDRPFWNAEVSNRWVSAMRLLQDGSSKGFRQS